MQVGAEYELFDSTDQPAIDEHIKRAVFHRVLTIALELGQHGREGKQVGCLFVIGDRRAVLDQSEQMILSTVHYLLIDRLRRLDQESFDG